MFYLRSYCPGPASMWSFSAAHMEGFQYLEMKSVLSNEHFLVLHQQTSD